MGKPALEKLRELWGASLLEAIEGMAGERPRITWLEQADLPAEELLWWEQGFSSDARWLIWIGVPAAEADLAGRRALAGAGVQEVSEEEARATWIELLNQAFSAMAQQLSELAGESVSAANGKVAPGPPPQGEPQLAELSLAGGEAIRLRMVISGDLEAAAEKWLAGPPPVESPALRPPPEREDHSYKTLDLLKDVELPVSVSFGRTQLPLQDVLKLTAGSVIELDRTIDEPVALIVNDTVVALGEVVVVEGNYGVRIQKIMSREDLLRTSGFR